MQKDSVSSHSVRGLLSGGKVQGYDINQLLRSCNIDPKILTTDQARISVRKFARLTKNLVLAMQDEQTGHLPRPLKPGAFAMICQSVIKCDTLGEVFHRIVDFFNLFDLGLTATLTVENDKAAFQLVPSESEFKYDAYTYESNLLIFYRFANWLICQHIPLEQVELNYSPPIPTEEYRLLFFSSPLKFNQNVNRLIFKSSFLNAPIRRSKHSLRQLFKRYTLDLIVQEYGCNSCESRIRAMIGNNPMDIPEFGEIAKQLGMHSQTLRRRLKEECTSYRDIKTQLRREIAINLLDKVALSVEEVAFQSGFSEASAFIRAFKSWTGITPLAYRKGLV